MMNITGKEGRAVADKSGRIGPLDGIRAVAVLMVVWYHFWQQSWLMPVAGPVNLDWMPRNGAICVDLMILLSGFCLFLPYARNMFREEKDPSAGQFYRKRAARIMPSYYVSLLIVLVCFAIPLGEYTGVSDMLGDLIPHIFFIHNWFGASFQSTHLNGVLWTVGVIVQFYVVFPFLAKAFKKRPMVTYWCMTAVGLLSSWIISHNFAQIDQSLFVNNTFTFASVYANGMLGAYVYAFMESKPERSRGEAVFFTAMSLTSIWIYKILCAHRQNYGQGLEQKWQVDYRYLLSLVFLLFVISTIFACKWYQKIWDNAVMRFLAAISFNLYICHQYIAVKLKEFHIPSWDGAEEPNVVGDAAWQWKYTILCIIVSLAVATAMTYLVEKPAARMILNKKRKMETTND